MPWFTLGQAEARSALQVSPEGAGAYTLGSPTTAFPGTVPLPTITTVQAPMMLLFSIIH